MKLMPVLYCLLFVTSCNSGPATTPDQGHQPHQQQLPDSVKEKLKNYTAYRVKILTTTDAIVDSNVAGTVPYPKQIAIDSVAGCGDQIAAYGAAYQVWIGPKGWTGHGAVDTGNNVRVDLFPAGGEDLKGAHVSYYELTSGTDLMQRAAAPYFTTAMDAYKKRHKNGSVIHTPDGVVIRHISSDLVTYSSPVSNGLVREGIAFYAPARKSEDMRYAEVFIVLPEAQKDLADFLMKVALKQINN